jgi:O-antigen/teichoic acid export membrane protein
MSFLKKGLFVSVGQASSVIFGVIGTMILARSLGKAGMGKYDLLRQAGVLSITVLSLGIGNASIFILNKQGEDYKKIVNLVIRFLMGVALVLLVGFTFLTLGYPRYFGEISPLVAIYYSVGISALLSINLLRALYVAWLNIKRILMADVLPSIFIVVGLLVLWHQNKLNTEWALTIYATGNILTMFGLLYAIFPLISFRIHVSRRLWGRIVSIGWKLLASNIFQVLSPALALLVLRYKTMVTEGFGIVGLYTRASALCGLAMLIPNAFGPLLYSKWTSSNHEEQKSSFEYAARLSFAYGVIIATILIVAGRYALFILYGRGFAAAQDAVYALAPSVALFTVTSAFINYFASVGKPEISAILLALSAAITISITSILVPRIGILGPGIALSIAQLFTVAAFSYLAKRLHGISISRSFILKRKDLSRIYSQASLVLHKK